MLALLRCGIFSMASYPQNMGQYPYRRQQSFIEGYRLECAFNARIAKTVMRGESLQGNGVTALVLQYEPSYLILNSQPMSLPLLTFKEYRSYVTICLRISRGAVFFNSSERCCLFPFLPADVCSCFQIGIPQFK